VSDRTLANRIASLYDSRSLQGYVRWKVRFDPIYEGVLAPLRDTTKPILDLGCGVGILSFFLREHGIASPILGIDFDERKIAQAKKAATRSRDIAFEVGDARAPLPDGYNVVVLDLLHYFDSASQQRILENVAHAVPPGGIVVIRQGLRDGSWRYRFTAIVDAIGRAIRWMRAEALNYPTRDEVTRAFADFDIAITPLWGGTPYNNYLFVLSRRNRGAVGLGPPE